MGWLLFGLTVEAFLLTVNFRVPIYGGGANFPRTPDPELVEGGQLLAIYVDPRIGAGAADANGERRGVK